MAKKEETKVVIEREYNVPLRKEWLKAPHYRRSKKAVTALKEFLIKHMKPSYDEKGRVLLNLGKELNEQVWVNGIKNPPHHVKIIAKKDDKGLVTANLEGVKIKAPKEEKKHAPKKVVHKEEKLDEKTIKERKEEHEELETIKKEKPRIVKRETEDIKEVEAHPTGPQHE